MSTATIEPSTEMSRLYEETLKDFTEGSIVVGRIIEKRKSDVLVDIGYKSEGLIGHEEFKSSDNIEPGTDIEVLLEALEDDELASAEPLPELFTPTPGTSFWASTCLCISSMDMQVTPRPPMALGLALKEFEDNHWAISSACFSSK